MTTADGGLGDAILPGKGLRVDQPQQRWTAEADPLAGEERPTIEGVLRDLKRVPFARLVATALFVLWAILFARFSWELPVSISTEEQGRTEWHFPARPGEPRLTIPISTDAERALFDLRQAIGERAKPAPQDPRILIIPYTQDTLRATEQRSPLDRAILAQALTNLDAMGAKAVGIDILIDQPQAEDAQLLEALRGMRTPVWLAYANRATAGDEIEQWQQQFMDDLAARLAGSAVRHTSVRFEADGDNVLRRWPTLPEGLPPFMPLALAGAPAAFQYHGSIDFRQPANPERPVFAKLPIDLFGDPATAPLLADQVKGRTVLIGGDLPDRDQFEIPSTRVDGPTMSGLEVHATMLAQLLDRRLPSPAGPLSLWVLAILVVLCGAFTAMLDVRPWVVALSILGQLLFFTGAPFLFEWTGTDTYGLPAFGWLGGWVLAYAATGAAVRAIGSDQRRYAQSALGKYLPHDIAVQILRDPAKLSLTGEKRAIFTLFTDIEGFTALSHAIPPERVASLLNAYLDGMSKIVLDHGGTIDKFVGDAVVAFWGAPIARPDDAHRALAALLAIVDFARDFAKEHQGAGAPLGRTRAGLHFGDAVVGNFGGEGRLTYTALGDAMNCAARLESANKQLKTVALVSDAVHDLSPSDLLRPMGRIALSGRSTPIAVWEPAPGMSPADRAELVRLWYAFDHGDRGALDAIEQICLTHDKDAALAAFACRLREAGPGGFVQLREK
ncbi:adenylate/guanylate cyclase domain-containing protein [Sphingomonas xanthus]|uniref:Adenylate/guanylate cyclase domain-containing protein n=1 Tax=Sphingomonas xanthus TaxID=2594473 RepID=A0A516IT44_9SPHN|nr:adenylate/guanylate cyclase domain-containing protein [Sphingomonas xanthus]QDP20067.1 adenylate/guanylate cyclase domain-containing protein [Sphingomonas xanthus]